ncbi:hypothetical protein BG005_000947, partial [Podila minutissima]
QQIHKIPIHLIKRSRAVLVKDLERLAPGVTRVVTYQGAELYPDSPDTDNTSSTPSSPRSPTFSVSASGGSQAYIPIPEGEEDNSIWFVHSRPANAVLEKEVPLHEHEQGEEEHHNDSRTRTQPYPLHQAQKQGLGRIYGQSKAAGRTRVQQQEAEFNAANRQNHRRMGSQESSSSSQHQDVDVAQCENPQCQETATTLAGFAQAVLAALGGDGQGDIVALQKMATKILDSTSSTNMIIHSTHLATPPQSRIFSTSSPSVSKSPQGIATPETTPVSTPVISASCTTHDSPPPPPPPVLFPQHHRHLSSSSSMVLSPSMTTDSFQSALSGQYPNPAALTLPSAMIAIESPKRTKKKKSAFLAIFQHRGEGDEKLTQGQGQGTAVEGKKAWFKTNRRRQTLPSSTAPGGSASSAQTAPTSPGGTSQPSTARRFSVPFGFHLKGAQSPSNNAAPPTPPLPPLSPLSMLPTSGQRQNSQYPASRRPSTPRRGSRTQVGTGSFLDSVSDESTTEDDGEEEEEEEEEVLERRGVAPQQLLQSSVQRQERYQAYDSDELTDTESEDSDDSEDDEQEEQVEEPRGQQQRRPWPRWTMRKSSNSSSSSPSTQQQTRRQRHQQGHIRWATSSSAADQTRQTLEGYEHNFDDAPPPAYQSSDLPPLPASSSSQGAVITPLSVSGSLARQYSIPPRNYHPSSSSPSTSRARATPPPQIPTRPPSASTFPVMQVISSSSSSSSSSLPLSTPLSLASSATSSSSTPSSSTTPLPTLLSLLHCLESRLRPSQRSAAFAKNQPSSSSPSARDMWRARQPGTVASFAYVLIALEQTGLAPGAMRASWREEASREAGGKTKEEMWLAMTGNSATERDLAKALLALAKEGLGSEAWSGGDSEDEDEEEVGSWDEWVERVEAYVV